jgi:hypothetical protein
MLMCVKLLTFADDHANGIRGYVYRLANLAWSTAEGVECITLFVLGRLMSILLRVTVNDLHDELSSASSSSRAADEVHRAETVNTLILTDDVDVAAGFLLKVTNGLATLANDKANATVRDHDLRRLFTIAKCRLLATRASFSGSTRITASLTCRVAPILLNDAVDLPLSSNASTWASCDPALSLWSAIWTIDELNPSSRFGLNAAKTLALPSNHETNQG